VTIARLAYLTVLCIVGFEHRQVTAQSSCRPPDEASERMLQWVKNIATGTDEHAADVREHTRIPFVSASQITYVTSQSVCNKALSPYNARAATQDASTGASIAPSGSLYIVKAATVYVVWDPAKSAGEYAYYVTLDSKYKVLWAGIG
jgi:hypothetical protein